MNMAAAVAVSLHDRHLHFMGDVTAAYQRIRKPFTALKVILACCVIASNSIDRYK